MLSRFSSQLELQQSMNVHGNRLASLLFLLVLTSGTLGFRFVEDGWSWFDAFYMTVISVTTVGYGEVHTLSTKGRVIAMGVLFGGLGVFGLVISQMTNFIVSGQLAGAFERKRVQRNIAKLLNHTIICGRGTQGLILIKAFSTKSKEAVVAIANGADASTLSYLRSNGINHIEGDPREEDQLLAMGLCKSSAVIVAVGNDDQNISIATRVKKHIEALSATTRVIATVGQYEAYSYFSDRLGALGVTLIDLDFEAALRLSNRIVNQWITTLADIPKRPLKVYIHASAKLRCALVRSLAMIGQMTAEKGINLNLFSTTLKEKLQFESKFPAVNYCCEIKWHSKSIEVVQLDLISPPDFVIFALESDIENLYQAEQILMKLPELRQDCVIACMSDSDDLREVALINDCSNRRPRIVFLYEDLCEADMTIGHIMEAEGRSIHDLYIKNLNSTERAVSWDLLPEFVKGSNRLAAMHRPLKQAFHQHLISLGVAEKDILDHLTVSEHHRWMAYHVMNGWSPSEYVIKERSVRTMSRKHHSIVPFEFLDEKTKALDFSNVLQALKLSQAKKIEA
jgi:voltage-gated potassium channel Kch